MDFLQEVNVYGVSVPGCEGKVGMAAVRLAPGQTFDGQRMYQHVRTWLPAYAAPHFIRIQVSSGWWKWRGGEVLARDSQ